MVVCTKKMQVMVEALIDDGMKARRHNAGFIISHGMLIFILRFFSFVVPFITLICFFDFLFLCLSPFALTKIGAKYI